MSGSKRFEIDSEDPYDSKNTFNKGQSSGISSSLLLLLIFILDENSKSYCSSKRIPTDDKGRQSQGMRNNQCTDF